MDLLKPTKLSLAIQKKKKGAPKTEDDEVLLILLIRQKNTGKKAVGFYRVGRHDQQQFSFAVS